RLVVIGGHSRGIGKTQLGGGVISALPLANWVAGKNTQYGDGGCATKGRGCDCAPTEQIAALDVGAAAQHTDSGGFFETGAAKSFWLRTKQGYLAEGMPVLREALAESQGLRQDGGLNVIVESNSLLQFVKPSLYVSVLDTQREDFKESARRMLDRADVFVF